MFARHRALTRTHGTVVHARAQLAANYIAQGELDEADAALVTFIASKRG